MNLSHLPSELMGADPEPRAMCSDLIVGFEHSQVNQVSTVPKLFVIVRGFFSFNCFLRSAIYLLQETTAQRTTQVG